MADLSFAVSRERERLRNKLKVELNPYFIYRRTAGMKTRGPGRALGRVLNLKVKPPPLLPNPRAEREGCSASTSHSTDLNSSRAPNSSMALFRCFKALRIVCRLNDTAFSSGNVTRVSVQFVKKEALFVNYVSDALYSICRVTSEYMITLPLPPLHTWKKGKPLFRLLIVDNTSRVHCAKFHVRRFSTRLLALQDR